MDVLNGYLGNGISFPFVIENGAIRIDGYETLIEASIRHILFWEFGTRFFTPTFGSKLHQLLGEPNDTVLVVLVKKFIIQALTSWEGRITLLEHTITMPELHHISITLKYKINATKEVTDLNFQYRF